MRIAGTDLEIQREPFARPFAFKGSAFHEKWHLVVRLEDDGGCVSYGVGGLAVLWSAPRVFAARTETGGNVLMAAVLDFALQRAQEVAFDSPLELLAALLPVVHEYAVRVTAEPKLPLTFTLNSLVALDNAVWILWARRRGVDSFEALIPDEQRLLLSRRAERLGVAPAIGYNMPLEQVKLLLAEGAGVLKLKLGHPGDGETMLAADVARLRDIHELARRFETPLSASGAVTYYLDLNGRYPDRDCLARLLDGASRLGCLDRIVVVEEPFAEERGETEVGDLAVRVAADESVHDPLDVVARAQQGYRALAIKPAGKTLSVTLGMLQAANEQALDVFVADNACAPWLLQWNKTVAARLAPLPEMTCGFMESNGPQNYARWSEMVGEHPCVGAVWLTARHGVYELDDDFYRRCGGVFLDPEPYIRLFLR